MQIKNKIKGRRSTFLLNYKGPQLLASSLPMSVTEKNQICLKFYSRNGK